MPPGTRRRRTPSSEPAPRGGRLVRGLEDDSAAGPSQAPSGGPARPAGSSAASSPTAGSPGGHSGCSARGPRRQVVRSAHPSPRGAPARPASGYCRALYPVSARPPFRCHYRRRDAVPVPLRVPGVQPLALRLPEGELPSRETFPAWGLLVSGTWLP